jgi:hypothetical protein
MPGFFMPWRSSIDSDKFAAMMDIPSGNGCAHDLDNAGHPRGFCGGISVLTSDSRRAIRRLSERLNITPCQWNR